MKFALKSMPIKDEMKIIQEKDDVTRRVLLGRMRTLKICYSVSQTSKTFHCFVHNVY